MSGCRQPAAQNRGETELMAFQEPFIGPKLAVGACSERQQLRRAQQEHRGVGIPPHASGGAQGIHEVIEPLQGQAEEAREEA